MDSNYFTNPLIFLIQTFFDIYIVIIMLRLILQLTRADFYNPLSQFIVKVTSPVLNPIRKVVPGYGGVDIASLLLMYALKVVEILLLVVISGFGFRLLESLIWALPALIALTLNVFLFAIIIQAILSWVRPDPYNPAMSILNSITAPVLKPFRKLVPPVSGLDLSPMAAIVTLYVAQMLILPPLYNLTGYPF